MKPVFYEIRKTDDDERMAYGYASTEALDSDGEVIERSAIIKAWDAYMEFANVREMHGRSAAGVVKEFSHDPVGTWVGVEVVDDQSWAKVKKAVYKGFSVGGRATSRKGTKITGLDLFEISLVDRPANPEAKIELWKAESTPDVDRLVKGLADALEQHAAKPAEDLMNEEEKTASEEEMVEKAAEPVVEKPVVVVEDAAEDAVEKADGVEATGEQEIKIDMGEEFGKALQQMNDQVAKMREANEELLKRVAELEGEPEDAKASLRAVAKGEDVEDIEADEGATDPLSMIRKVHAAGGKRGMI